MKVVRVILAVITTMTVLLEAEAEVHAQSDVTVRAMNPNLKLTGQVVTWSVPGEILSPLVTAPGGETLLVVQAADGALELQRRDQNGKELTRVPLASSGRLLAARLFGEGLLVALEGELALFDRTTLQQKERAPLGVPASQGDFVLGPRGLWTLGATHLVYSDLGGATWTRPFPLVPWNVPPCPAPGGCIDETLARMADVTDAGALLLTEIVLEKHPIKGGYERTDAVSISRGIWLDPAGKVLSSKMLSGVESYGEWFWHESGSASPVGFSGEYGLYRTRYRDDGPTGGTITGGSSFVVVQRRRGSRNILLTAFDSTSRVVWERRVEVDGNATFSPTWTTPRLLHDADCVRFAAIDARGNLVAQSEIDLIDAIYQMKRKTKFKLPHFAIGQATDGTWLLIAYAPRLPP